GTTYHFREDVYLVNDGITLYGDDATFRPSYLPGRFYRVTTNGDDGLGVLDTAHAGTVNDPILATELRTAIDATNYELGSTITFDPALEGQTITLNGTQLNVQSP